MMKNFKTWLNEFLYGKEEKPIKTTKSCNCDCKGNCVCGCGCNGECQCKRTVILPIEKVEIQQEQIVVPVREPLPPVALPTIKKGKKPFSTKEAAKNKTAKKSSNKRPNKK